MWKKLISAAALGAGGAAVAAVLKKKDICPICEAKKLLAKAGVHAKASGGCGNGVALTPPMGWSSWNTFQSEIDEKLIKDVADAMKKSGLLDAGYRYINIDDCWESSVRDDRGRLQADFMKFPGGIKALVREINKKGFRLGIYSSNGTMTCANMPASLGYERIDAETFADWGIEYFKYDFCHNKALPCGAPHIEKLVISGGALSEELVLEAVDGELFGTARARADGRDGCVSGLDSGCGALRFSFVNIPKEGEYVVTLLIRKVFKNNKYLELTVNDEDVYPIPVSPTGLCFPSGRLQLKARLREGANSLELKNPVGSRMDSAAAQYRNMGRELKRATKLYAQKRRGAEKPIVYSICEWGANLPWKWGASAGNLWRTTGDIQASWASIVGIYEINVKLWKHAFPGAWNDPDMLEVGNGNLSYEENRSHFTLWCMMAAPLILGNDVRKFILPDGTVDRDNKVLRILTDKDLIAVDQDAKGAQCRRMKTTGLTDVLVKPLSDGETAVCLFNKALRELPMRVSLREVANLVYTDLPPCENYRYTELWSKKPGETDDEIIADVPAHGVKIYRVKAG